MSITITDVYKYLNKVFKDEQLKYQFQSERIFESMSSNRATENYLEKGSVGLLPQTAKGAALTYDDINVGNETVIKNLTYKLGIKIAEEDMEDDLYHVYDNAAQSLALSNYQTIETIAFNIFNNAFDNTYVGGDGKELCATDHVLLNGGTASNELATPAALSMTSFQAMRTLIRNMVNNQSQPINAMMKNIIIPPDLYRKAEEIIGSSQDPESSNNAINPYKGKVSIIESPYLTNTQRWFVQTDIPGLIHQKRKGVQLKNESDFETGDAKFAIRQRSKLHWTSWRSVCGSAI